MQSGFFSNAKNITGSFFTTENGSDEIYLRVASEEKVVFADELESLCESYLYAITAQGLSEETLVFSRIYLSDMANQKGDLLNSRLYKELRKGALSIIQQAPINGGSVAILSYHIKNNSRQPSKEIVAADSGHWGNVLTLRGKHYDMFWNAGLSVDKPFDSSKQTVEIFEDFNRLLESNGMNMLNNSVRTWVYVRDIDNHYAGMVDARREYFIRHGLTPETRYLASTGIEGVLKEVSTLVHLDALSIRGLKNGQIIRMEALDHLSPTIKYGVTFERGLRVRFGDRSHLYISGTASIDKEGNVVHLGDVGMQTVRTIENLRALLEPHNASLNDMAYLIVYLRNFKDKKKVLNILEKEIPQNIPLLFVQGSVCRPTWLMEIEGVAVTPDSTEFPPFI
jgi:enamine deaminase RidA (YjgF/YER057c/UK114 family)